MTSKTPSILLTDFYKWSHFEQYAPNTELVYSTLTPRSNKYFPVANEVVVFGLQAFFKKLNEEFNENFFNQDKEEVIGLYKKIQEKSLSNPNPKTDHIEALYDLGYLPIEVRALPEGSLAPIRVPVMTIQNTLPEFFWITNFLETYLSANTWQSMTSATLSHQYRKLLDKYAIDTTGSTEGVDFQAHDFSMRGMSSLESAVSSGAAHLISFKGTDTIPAIWHLMEYYNADLDNEFIAGSIPATEHSVMCSYGETNEFDLFKRLITEVYPSGFFSVVSDTWDFWKVVTEYLPALKAEIMNRDGRVVIRPDCYDEETQILTNSGWKYFKDLTKEDLVAQVLEDGTYEFVKPLKYVNEHYKGEMIRFNDRHGKVDLLVTPNHRMIIQQTNSKTKETEERVVFAEKLKEKGNHNQKMLRSAKAKIFNKELTDVERLKIAFQADGSYTTSGNKIRFSFAKERKMDRLEAICYQVGISFDKYDLSDGRVEYRLNTDSTKFQKDFSWVDTTNLDGDWCVDFIEELSYWDSTRRSEDRFKFDTTNKEVSDVVELIALSAGYGDLISIFEDNREEHFNTVYNHNILKDNVVGGQSWKKTVEQYDGNIYCVQVPTGRLIVKRGRGTMVCGNSGNPVEILCGKINHDADLTKYYTGDLKDLEDDIYDLAYEWASDDCEGSHNCGNDFYTVKFKVNDKIYSVEVGFSYSRHDKTYYYVEKFGFSDEGVQWDTLKELETSIEDIGLIEALYNIFGGGVNGKGYKVLDTHIGAIYGDSITLERAELICERLKEKGFASTNVVFGVGSYSFQYNTRDTLGFAVKATYAVVDGEGRKLFKDPKTDDGTKKSQKGAVLVVEGEDGKLKLEDGYDLLSDEYKSNMNRDVMEVIYLNGELTKEDSLSAIRERLAKNTK